VLARCNKDSQNLFAEALIKRLGHEATGEPGSWSSGAAAERMFLSRALGPQAARFVIDDGSGLSRDNRVSAELLTGVLLAMHRNPTLAKTYRESLSVGGKDGSLRLRFRGRGFASTVEGKSGYIDGVIALSGYIRQGDDDYAFSIMLNDYDQVYKGKRLIDRIVGAVDGYLAGRRVDLARLQESR
jgi:D-alanyl-D-alanine carboxypeptidase/D-alanyl-D-alanine-endopeptidase (penicillin-binding protein 4)